MAPILTLPLPPEYVALCERDKLQHQEIIAAFIADLCCIVPPRGVPRRDRYSSTGCDGRSLAWEYYEAVGFATRNIPPQDD